MLIKSFFNILFWRGLLKSYFNDFLKMHLCQQKYVLQKYTTVGIWEDATNCKLFMQRAAYIGSWQDENNRLKCFSVYDGEKGIIVCSFCPVNWSYSGTVKCWKGSTKQRTKRFSCINTIFFVCHLVLLSTSNFLNWSLK